jgi:hypothetical protein
MVICGGVDKRDLHEGNVIGGPWERNLKNNVGELVEKNRWKFGVQTFGRVVG